MHKVFNNGILILYNCTLLDSQQLVVYKQLLPTVNHYNHNNCKISMLDSCTFAGLIKASIIIPIYMAMGMGMQVTTLHSELQTLFLHLMKWGLQHGVLLFNQSCQVLLLDPLAVAVAHPLHIVPTSCRISI